MSFHKNCLICGGTNIYLLNGFEDSYLHKCNSCKFIFSLKIPSLEELQNHYQGYKRNDYLSPITITRYNELLDSFEKYRKTNKILDVGCGIGFFLTEAKRRGWDVYGTEYTDDAVKICKGKGINVIKGPLTSKNYPPESFDIITSFEVIEHLNNPNHEVQQFYKILRKGGLVYVTTPNFNSLLRFYLKNNYNVISYPEHLSYYTKSTLKKVFTIQGFKALKIQSTGISLTRFKTSKGISSQSFISKSSDDEKLRNSIESSQLLQVIKKAINSILTIIGIGDHLKGYFIK